MKFKKGDRVAFVEFEGVCSTGEMDVGGNKFVSLEGHKGVFDVNDLRKIDDQRIDFAKILGNKVNDGEMDCFIEASCPKHGDCVKCLMEWAGEIKKGM